MATTTKTFMQGCNVNAAINLNAQSQAILIGNICGSIATFDTSGANRKYNSSTCYRPEEHRMYKATDTSCPCSEKVALYVSSEEGQEIRIYPDDIVFFNSQKEFEFSLHDVLEKMGSQQRDIADLKEEIRSLKRKKK